MLNKLYKSISPYIVPALIALSLLFYMKPAEIVMVPSKPNVITVTKYLPAKTDTITHTVIDTVYTPEYIYLPGDTIRIEVNSADTTLHFVSDSVEVDVQVEAVYYHRPLNVIKLTGELVSARLTYQPYTLKKLVFSTGFFTHNKKVGVTVGATLHSMHSLVVGHDGSSLMLNYQRNFK